jgi:hypothetical protein
VDFMQKENRPTISEVQSLSEVTGPKPSFVLVGNPVAYADVNKVAAEKKAHVNFYWVAAVEGQTEGSVLLVEAGVMSKALAAGGDVSKFVSENAYPLVGQLTPENYQFYMDRGMDMFWFGLAPTDSATVTAIVAGVQEYKDKFSYVWLD